MWNGIVSWKVDQGCFLLPQKLSILNGRKESTYIDYLLCDHYAQSSEQAYKTPVIIFNTWGSQLPPSRGRNETLIQVCQIPKFSVFSFDHIAFQPTAINNRLKMLITSFAQTFFMSSLEFNFKNTFTVCTLLA